MLSSDKLQRFARAPSNALFLPDSTPLAAADSPIAIDCAPVVPDDSVDKPGPCPPSPPSPPLSLASSIASRPSSPVFNPVSLTPETCALPRSCAFSFKVEALEAWLTVNLFRLPTGSAHASAHTFGHKFIEMEETYELGLDIAWDANSKPQEFRYARMLRVKHRVMRVMDGYLDHTHGPAKRAAPTSIRPKVQYTPKHYAPSSLAETSFVSLSTIRQELDLPHPPSLSRPRPRRSVARDSKSRPRRSRSPSRGRQSTRLEKRDRGERLHKRVLLHEACKVETRRAQSVADIVEKLAKRRRALRGAVSEDADAREATQLAAHTDVTPTTATSDVDLGVVGERTVITDWRIAADEDDDAEYFAAPPSFIS